MIKRNFKHQVKEVFDQAAHLKHLQMMLQKMDPAIISNEKIMIQYFWEVLKPSIWVHLNIRG